MQLTVVVQPDTLPSGDPIFTAYCSEIDIASQGETRESAVANLKEALDGFFQVADDAEIGRRLRHGAGATMTTVEVAA